MLVVIADIKLKEGVESEFITYVSETNKILAKIDGFISRRLLKSNKGDFRIMVEHQSMETFQKMHETAEHDKVRAGALEFMEGGPMPTIYSVVSS